MVAVARGIKVLTLVSWPASVQQRFLEGHARGHDVPPRIEYPRHDFGDARRELDAIAAAADPAHPLGAYLVESTRSWRSEEHTSELQSLMRISYAVFCLKKKKNNNTKTQPHNP